MALGPERSQVAAVDRDSATPAQVAHDVGRVGHQVAGQHIHGAVAHRNHVCAFLQRVHGFDDRNRVAFGVGFVAPLPSIVGQRVDGDGRDAAARVVCPQPALSGCAKANAPARHGAAVAPRQAFDVAEDAQVGIGPQRQIVGPAGGLAVKLEVPAGIGCHAVDDAGTRQGAAVHDVDAHAVGCLRGQHAAESIGRALKAYAEGVVLRAELGCGVADVKRNPHLRQQRVQATTERVELVDLRGRGGVQVEPDASGCRANVSRRIAGDQWETAADDSDRPVVERPGDQRKIARNGSNGRHAAEERAGNQRQRSVYRRCDRCESGEHASDQRQIASGNACNGIATDELASD